MSPTNAPLLPQLRFGVHSTVSMAGKGEKRGYGEMMQLTPSALSAIPTGVGLSKDEDLGPGHQGHGLQQSGELSISAVVVLSLKGGRDASCSPDSLSTRPAPPALMSRDAVPPCERLTLSTPPVAVERSHEYRKVNLCANPLGGCAHGRRRSRSVDLACPGVSRAKVPMLWRVIRSRMHGVPAALHDMSYAWRHFPMSLAVFSLPRVRVAPVFDLRQLLLSVAGLTANALWLPAPACCSIAVSRLPVLSAVAPRIVARQAGAQLPESAPRDPTVSVTWPPDSSDLRLSNFTGVFPAYPSHCPFCPPSRATAWGPVDCARLRWPPKFPRGHSTHCDRCLLTFYPTVYVGRMGSPPELRSTDRTLARVIWNTVYTNWHRMRPFAVTDYRYGSLMSHPEDGEVIVVTRMGCPIACLPIRQARYLRALYLANPRVGHVSHLNRVNESDVAAAVIAVCVSDGGSPGVINAACWPAPPAQAFRGDQHVFQGWDYLYEPGGHRPAALPLRLGPVPFGDPSTSAFAPILNLGSKLSAAGHFEQFARHPFGAFLFNSLTVGFPTYAQPPWKFVKPRRSQLSVEGDPRIAKQEDEEIAAGWIKCVDDWPKSIPLIFNDWFAARTGGKFRGVLNQSVPGGPNNFVRRDPQFRAQLASWSLIAERIRFLRKMYPGQQIHAAKLDLVKAFRQLMVAINKWWTTAQMIRGHRYVNPSLTLGATCSVDTMTQSPTALVHVLSSLFADFLQVYVDDLLLIDVAWRLPFALKRARDVLGLLKWAINEVKFEDGGKPAPVIEFLGTQLDLNSCTLSITSKRLNSIMGLLQRWEDGSIKPTIKHLASLAGTLNFVSLVIPFGRVFAAKLRSLADLPSADVQARVSFNVRWWQLLLSRFNGVASFLPLPDSVVPLHFTSDAASSGWGVVCTQRAEWAHGRWTQSELDDFGIAQREAAAIVFGLDMFTQADDPPLILVAHTDSHASHDVFTNLRAHDERMLDVLRICALLQLESNTRLVTTHLRGVDNPLSDGASRVHALPESLSYFKERHPSTRVRRMIVSGMPIPTRTGGQTSFTPALLQSQGLRFPLPPASTSLSTAVSTGMSRSRPFPMILWSTADWASKGLDGFCT